MLLSRELICLCLWFSMIYTQQPWLWECGKAAFWLFQAIVGIEGKRFLFFLNFHMSGISIAFFGFDQTGRHRSPPGHTSGAPPIRGRRRKCLCPFKIILAAGCFSFLSVCRLPLVGAARRFASKAFRLVTPFGAVHSFIYPGIGEGPFPGTSSLDVASHICPRTGRRPDNPITRRSFQTLFHHGYLRLCCHACQTPVR